MADNGGPILDDNAKKIYEELGGLDVGDREVKPDEPGRAPYNGGAAKDAVLGVDAQKIYEEFGGLDTESSMSDIIGWSTGLAKSLSLEAKPIDAWRLLLIELAHRLAMCLAGFTFTFSEQSPKDDVERLIETLTSLSRMPNHGGSILIRHRGLAKPLDALVTSELDYTVSFGDLVLDVPAAAATAERDLATLHDSPVRLKKAFERLSALNINNIHLAIGGWGPVDRERMARCFRVLQQHGMEMAGEEDVTFEEGKQEDGATTIKNERGHPDTNLTLLAGVNGLKPETVRTLVQKVDRFMKQQGKDAMFDRYANVYEAIFAFKNLRLQLIKPPVEVNNIRWLIADDQGKVRKEEMHGARRIMDRCAEDPRKAAALIDSLYRKDYSALNTRTLVDRLQLLSDYVGEIEQDPAGKEDTLDLLKRLRLRLGEVQSDVLDAVRPIKTGIEIKIKDQKPENVPLGPRIVRSVVFQKKRLETKQKIKDMINKPVEFGVPEFETVAADFNISVAAAQRLLELLKTCFSPDGQFLRLSFERNIPEFAAHGDPVFEFLWHYLKEAIVRSERVSFLNALQVFIDRIQKNESALRILLEDFISSPSKVQFYDRNAMMLANILTRKYNKELTTDLDYTPDEVLMVTKGLDENVIRAAGRFINMEQEGFHKKAKAIHLSLKEALDIPQGRDPVMPINYLITLEREFFIFMSLVGGESAHGIVRAAAKEFGNFDSEIYNRRRSKQHMNSLLSLLEIAVRGLARFGDRVDRVIFRDILDAREGYINLAFELADHERNVKRVMRWVDTSLKTVSVSQ